MSQSQPNRTPRLSSRFPETPQVSRQSQAGTPRRDGGPRITSPLRDAPALNKSAAPSGPLIPLDIIDAPQQRLLVVSIYAAILAWRLYDFHALNEEDTESLWAFMKWVLLDGACLFALPELRIPWLEWSPSTMVIIFLLHACMDGILMFRIPIPLGAAFLALSKLVYDRETTISGGSVKYSNLIQDSSLLLGRQIIKILPEGSATLNPGKEHFCLGGSTSQVTLPVRINQTQPISMSLVHFDLDTNLNDTSIFTTSQIRKLMKDAAKSSGTSGVDGTLTIHLTVKRPGMYKLGKVVDKTGLEVRRRVIGDTFVAVCPQAIIKPLAQHRCRGESSNVELEVIGTPPLRVKYRKLINQVEQKAQLQGIQPEDLVSPLSHKAGQSALTLASKTDITWARPRSVSVPLSEGLGTSGRWAFSLEEVQDAFGNKVSYSSKDHDKQEKHNSKAAHLHQVITVHERPTVVLAGCSPQRPLQVARGRSAPLPVTLGSTGKGGILGSPYQVEYLFTPESELTPAGDHAPSPRTETFAIQSQNQRPKIDQAGLYTLSGVSSEHCQGEVLEPASCLLQNPPEPSLKLKAEEIFDKCAQKGIGLRVDFHLTGSPPFQIQCIMRRKDQDQASVRFLDVQGLRGQADLTPPEAGHYVYHFTEVSDSVYKGHSLREQHLVLEQDVKPSAHASFVSNQPRSICIDQQVKYAVRVRGEGPFTVEYELVRGSQRTPYKLENILSDVFEIVTRPLAKGGDYTLALTSITDGMGCKEALSAEAKISVRHQKPKASFGVVEGSRTISTLENKRVALPLKLTGEGPWTVEYRQDGQTKQIHVRQPNDKIEVDTQGTFELVSMQDAICPGTIETSASTMQIEWISRPSLSFQAETFQSVSGTTYTKHDVCEGDEDSVDLHLRGSPPFEVKYEEHVNKALKSNTINAALGVTTVRLDTSHAGHVEYRFKQLADANYDHSNRHFQTTIVQQHVHARPFAKFNNPGKTYSYCTSLSQKVDTISLTLTGTPPFSIDYEMKYSGKATPRIHTVSDIKGHTYSLTIPAKELRAGTSAVSLRKVTDARGCTRTLASTEPRVQISVHAAPAIAPLDAKQDFCVGDRLSFSLSGTAPFNVYYTFDGKERKASVAGTIFRRLAEKAGDFRITGVSDSGSGCRADVSYAARIHGLPSARISDGREEEKDIHEGGSTDIEFVFGGEAPWEFTWTRSRLAGRGKRGEVLEMRSETSQEGNFRLRAGDEGAYEVVRVRDRWCEVKREGVELGEKVGQKRLTN